jgi:hypothetical protein
VGQAKLEIRQSCCVSLVAPGQGFDSPHLRGLCVVDGNLAHAYNFVVGCDVVQFVHAVNDRGEFLFAIRHGVIATWVEEKANCFLAKGLFAHLICSWLKNKRRAAGGFIFTGLEPNPLPRQPCKTISYLSVEKLLAISRLKNYQLSLG